MHWPQPFLLPTTEALQRPFVAAPYSPPNLSGRYLPSPTNSAGTADATRRPPRSILKKSVSRSGRLASSPLLPFWNNSLAFSPIQEKSPRGCLEPSPANSFKGIESPGRTTTETTPTTKSQKVKFILEDSSKGGTCDPRDASRFVIKYPRSNESSGSGNTRLATGSTGKDRSALPRTTLQTSRGCFRSTPLAKVFEDNNDANDANAVKRGTKRIRTREKHRHRAGRLSRRNIEMAVKTPPGPLSLALYILLCVVSIGASIFFGLSEWRVVQTRAELLPFHTDYVPASCEAVPALENRLIHIDCPLRRLATFYPPAEFSANLDPFEGLFLEMRIEMFQWELHSHFLGFSYRGTWSSNLIDSSKYPFVIYNSHINPDFFPRVNGAGRQFAPYVFGGDYRLAKQHLLDFHGKKRLSLRDDGFYKPPKERPALSVSAANTHVFQDALYTGDPLHPKIGDLRVSFWGSTATHVSAMGKQWLDRRDGVYELVPYEIPNLRESTVDVRKPLNHIPMPLQNAFPAVSKTFSTPMTSQMTDISPSEEHNSNVVLEELVAEGDATAADMIARTVRRRDGSQVALWAIRLIFAFLLTCLVTFTHRLLDPSPRVAVVPLLIGSTAVAWGIIFVLWAPFWIRCAEYWTVAGMWLAAPILIVGGVFLWAWGRSCAVEKDYTAGIALTGSDGAKERSTTDLLLPRAASTGEHFYQPV